MSWGGVLPSWLRSLGGILPDAALAQVVDDAALSLVEVWPRLYAAGMPWSGPTSNGALRNNVDELVAHLDARHGRPNYLVINLAPAEHDRGDAERLRYDPERLGGNVLHFEPAVSDDAIMRRDDGLALVFHDCFRCAYAIDFWLRWSPRHVVVVHGYTSPARPAAVIAAYIHWRHPQQHLDVITALNAVLTAWQPRRRLTLSRSWRQNLLAFNTLCQQGRPAPPRTHRLLLLLAELRGSVEAWSSEDVCLEVWQDVRCIWNSETASAGSFIWSEGSLKATIGVAVTGDVTFHLYYYAIAASNTAIATSPTDSPTSAFHSVAGADAAAVADELRVRRPVLRFAFNTNAMPSDAIPVSADAVDLFVRPDVVMPKAFSMTMVLAPEPTPSTPQVEGDWDFASAVNMSPFGCNAALAGLYFFTGAHAVFPEVNCVQTLVAETGLPVLVVTAALQASVRDIGVARSMLKLPLIGRLCTALIRRPTLIALDSDDTLDCGGDTTVCIGQTCDSEHEGPCTSSTADATPVMEKVAELSHTDDAAVDSITCRTPQTAIAAGDGERHDAAQSFSRMVASERTSPARSILLPALVTAVTMLLEGAKSDLLGSAGAQSRNGHGDVGSIPLRITAAIRHAMHEQCSNVLTTSLARLTPLVEAALCRSEVDWRVSAPITNVERQPESLKQDDRALRLIIADIAKSPCPPLFLAALRLATAVCVAETKVLHGYYLFQRAAGDVDVTQRTECADGALVVAMKSAVGSNESSAVTVVHDAGSAPRMPIMSAGIPDEVVLRTSSVVQAAVDQWQAALSLLDVRTIGQLLSDLVILDDADFSYKVDCDTRSAPSDRQFLVPPTSMESQNACSASPTVDSIAQVLSVRRMRSRDAADISIRSLQRGPAAASWFGSVFSAVLESVTPAAAHSTTSGTNMTFPTANSTAIDPSRFAGVSDVSERSSSREVSPSIAATSGLTPPHALPPGSTPPAMRQLWRISGMRLDHVGASSDDAVLNADARERRRVASVQTIAAILTANSQLALVLDLLMAESAPFLLVARGVHSWCEGESRDSQIMDAASSTLHQKPSVDVVTLPAVIGSDRASPVVTVESCVQTPPSSLAADVFGMPFADFVHDTGSQPSISADTEQANSNADGLTNECGVTDAKNDTAIADSELTLSSLPRCGTTQDGVKMSLQSENALADVKHTAEALIRSSAIACSPDVTKYTNMLRMGIPRGAVVQRMIMDGLDPTQLDVRSAPQQSIPTKVPLIHPPNAKLGPAFALSSSANAAASSGDTVKPDSDAASSTRFELMLKRGVPPPAVLHKIRSEGIDIDTLSLSLAAALGVDQNSEHRRGKVTASSVEPILPTYNHGTDDNIPHKEGEDKTAALAAARAERVRALKQEQLDLVADIRTPLMTHKVFGRWIKMLAVGIPREVVAARMATAGLDPTILSLPPDEPPPPVELVPLREDTAYARYFRMLKVGLQRDAIQHKMIADGTNELALELDADLPAPPGLNDKTPLLALSRVGPAIRSTKAPLRRQRKRWHWEALPPERAGGETIWAAQSYQVDDGSTSQVAFAGDDDDDEFDRLFTLEVAESGTSVRRKPIVGRAVGSGRVDYLTGDMKRERNVGIGLAKLRVAPTIIRDLLLALRHSTCAPLIASPSATVIASSVNVSLTPEQLTLLEELLPDPNTDELNRAKAFRGDVSRLSEASRFWVILSDVPKARARAAALSFQLQFDSRVVDLERRVTMLTRACNEVRLSARLPRILLAARTLGNRLNASDAAGATNDPKHQTVLAFRLESLLRLAQTRAFDGRTTALRYLVGRLARRDPDALRVRDELPSTVGASRLSLESIRGDITALRAGLQMAERLVREQGRGGLGIPSSSGSVPLSSSRVVSSSADALLGQTADDGEGLPDFVGRAQTRLAELAQADESARVRFTSLLAYLSEDSSMTPESLFGQLHSFLEMLRTEVSVLPSALQDSPARVEGTKSDSPASVGAASFTADAHRANVTPSVPEPREDRNSTHDHDYLPQASLS